MIVVGVFMTVLILALLTSVKSLSCRGQRFCCILATARKVCAHSPDYPKTGSKQPSFGLNQSQNSEKALLKG
ncbi:predicted protein [Brucella ceti B1/94]|nr:predicted protein [Brucella ceti B1/94]